MSKFQVDTVSRIDSFLAYSLKNISRSKTAQFIKKYGVIVGGEQVNKPSFKLFPGDNVQIDDDLVRGFMKGEDEKRVLGAFGDSGDQSVIKPEPMDLDIVYEDDDLLVLDKEVGMVVHPGVGNFDGTIANGLAYYFEKIKKDIPSRVGIVHRLDKDVAGLLVIAKNNSSLSALSDQFRGDRDEDDPLKAEKIYWAVVETNDVIKSLREEEVFEIEGYMSRSKRDRKKFVLSKYSDDGRYSLSKVKVLNKGINYNLLEVRLVTGRTHQIRVHLSSRGIPVVNDTLYGGLDIHIEGIALRCIKLEFIHPKVYLDLMAKGFIKNSNISDSFNPSSVVKISMSNPMVPLDLKV